jgi:hypothetical protein
MTIEKYRIRLKRLVFLNNKYLLSKDRFLFMATREKIMELMLIKNSNGIYIWRVYFPADLPFER